MSLDCNFINCFLYRWVVKIQNRKQQDRKYLYKYKRISWIENICRYGPRQLPLPGLLDKCSGVRKCSGDGCSCGETVSRSLELFWVWVVCRLCLWELGSREWDLPAGNQDTPLSKGCQRQSSEMWQEMVVGVGRLHTGHWDFTKWGWDTEYSYGV